jgi:hypothetical protein
MTGRNQMTVGLIPAMGNGVVPSGSYIAEYTRTAEASGFDSTRRTRGVAKG